MAKRRGGAQGRIRQPVGNPNPAGPAAPLPQTISTPPQQTVVGAMGQPGMAPYPAMPKVSDERPLLTTIGATGTAIFSGILQTDEYNPDFYWRDGTTIYEQMLRSDAQINATRSMIELPLRRAKWSIKPASDSARDQEIASFIETCLFHEMSYKTASGRVLHQKWDDILRHILLCLWHGYMAFEVVWKVEDGWTKWAQWLPLLPRTVWRWWVGTDNELVGIQQWTYRDYTYEFREIPADKLLLFVHRQEGNNFEGVSLLRTSYKNWFFKTQYEKIQAIGIERNAIVPPVVKLPPNFTASDKQYALSLVQNLRVNELMGATIPSDWDLVYPHMGGDLTAVDKAIQTQDVMIARNILAQFINLGSTEVGSYSQDKSQKMTFLSAIQAYAEYIEDVINSTAIPRLVDYNFAHVDVYPTLSCAKVLAQDLEIVGDLIKNLSARSPTPFITATPELEEFLDDLIGLPIAPRSAVVATNPTAPGQPAPPEAPPAAPAPPPAPAAPQPPPAPTTQERTRSDATRMMETATLLREAWFAMDAVERGLPEHADKKKDETVKLFNPNHDDAGRFATGGGSGDGKLEAARSRLTAAHAHVQSLEAQRSTLNDVQDTAWEAMRQAPAGSAELVAAQKQVESINQQYKDHLVAQRQAMDAYSKASSEYEAMLPQPAGYVVATPEGRSALHEMFGRHVSNVEMAGMVGAQPGDTVYVDDDSPIIHLRLKSATYGARRGLSTFSDGHIVMMNEQFVVNDQGKGTGTKVFADQVRGLSHMGVDRIETTAGRGEALLQGRDVRDMVGYHVWPRLGYDAAIPAHLASRLPRGLAGASKVSDLMRTPEGRAWWKENGDSTHMTFDLKPGSASRQILKAYVEAKGMDSTGLRERSGAGHWTDMDWSDADDAITDRVWDTFHGQGSATLAESETVMLFNPNHGAGGPKSNGARAKHTVEPTP